MSFCCDARFPLAGRTAMGGRVRMSVDDVSARYVSARLRRSAHGSLRPIASTSCSNGESFGGQGEHR